MNVAASIFRIIPKTVFPPFFYVTDFRPGKLKMTRFNLSLKTGRAAILVAAILLAFTGCSNNGHEKDGKRGFPFGSNQPLAKRITFSSTGDSLSGKLHSFEICGLTKSELETVKNADLSQAQWRRILRIYVAKTRKDSSHSELVGMLGDYTVEECIRFAPRYPLAAGVIYNTRFYIGEFAKLAGLGDSKIPNSAVMEAFAGPTVFEPPMPSTMVAGVYPSASSLPENLLKFYIHFSAPMSQGLAYENIRLLDENGEIIEKAYVEIEQELWDPDRRRFTLLFDPGRIKRGLRPHDELGAPLQAGKAYSLVVDSAWRDGRGAPLKQAFRKKFTISAADRRSPDYKKWNISAPKSDSRAPLKLQFDEPLDSALLLRFIKIESLETGVISGDISITENETAWLFTPDMAWRSGNYRLKVNTRIEDAAGNTLQFLFDEDVESPSKGVDAAFVFLPFSVEK